MRTHPRSTLIVAGLASLVMLTAATAAAAPASGVGTRAGRVTPTAGSPLGAAAGFGLFVLSQAELNGTSIGAPVAVRDVLRTGGSLTVAGQFGGSFTAVGDSRPTGLIAGSLDLGSGDVLTVGSQDYAKVAGLSGWTVTDTDSSGHPNADTQIVRTTYGSAPRVQLGVSQPTASVGPAQPFDWGSAAADLVSVAQNADTCQPTTTPENGTIHIRPGTNVISGPLPQGTLQVDHPLSAGTTLLINLSSGRDLDVPYILGADPRYILINLGSGPGLYTLDGDLDGTLLAPEADVTQLPLEGSLTGAVISSIARIRNFTAVPFAGTLNCGSGLGGYGPPVAVPGGRPHAYGY